MIFHRKVLIEKDLPKEEKETISFQNISFFKEAAHRKLCGYGYQVSRKYVLWKSEKISWNHLRYDYGIRWSDKLQFFQIWNTSHNSQRALMFGFWKFYIEIIYYRAGSFNQKRKFIFRKQLWKFYQLVA